MISTLLDRFLGKPTQESVAKQLTALMHAKGATNIRFDAAQGMLHYVYEGNNGMTNVNSIYREVSSLPRSQRQAALLRYFEGVWQQGDQLPNTYEEALPKLLPIVRHSTEIALNAMRIESFIDENPALSKVVQSQVTEDLAVLLVIDLPNTMSQVTDTQLKSWCVTFDQALKDALDNLRKMTDESKWTQAGDGVWIGQWNDSYESSRLLLPDIIYRLGISEPVAMVPFRNTLFVTAAGNQNGIEQIANFVVENLDGPRKHLLFEVLELKDKDWHTAATQPQSLAKTRLLASHGYYDQQKALLEERLKKKNDDVFVASFSGLQKDDGSVFSYAAWTKNVETLLPKADMIIFVDPVDETKRYKLAWDAVAENFGALMVPTGDTPPRWRVSSYPDDEALKALAETAA